MMFCDGAKRDEVGADDRTDDAHAADGERHQHHDRLHVAGGEDLGQQHGGDDGDGIGLEQIGGHAGAVADIVADIVGDHGRIARIVLGDAGFDLADEVGADIRTLGEDAAAKAREDGDQRGAEAERHQRLDGRARIEAEMLQDEVVDRRRRAGRGRRPAGR